MGNKIGLKNHDLYLVANHRSSSVNGPSSDATATATVTVAEDD